MVAQLVLDEIVREWSSHSGGGENRACLRQAVKIAK
jgi:hypothetical protein